jgi:hypothetical protein
MMVKLADFDRMNAPLYVNAALFARGMLMKVDKNYAGVMCITSRPRSNKELEDLMEFAGFLTQNN